MQAGTKRKHNTGTLYYSKKRDRWVARFGRKTKVRRTEEEARIQLSLMLTDGSPYADPKSDPTVREVIERWFESQHVKDLARNSQISYRQSFATHIEPIIGDRSARNPNLQYLVDEMTASGSSPSTVNTASSVVRGAFHHSRLPNPAEFVKMPKIRRGEHQIIPPDRIPEFMELCKGERLGALFILAVTTGMRQGEMLGLYWQDIDLDKKTVKIARQLQLFDGKPEIVTVKTRKSRRMLHLSETAVTALRAHQTAMELEEFKQPTEYVFHSPRGHAIHRGNLQSPLNRLCEALNIEPVTCHALRHSTATYLLSLGVSPKVIQELLGHASITTTLDLYASTTPGMHADAAALFDGATS